MDLADPALGEVNEITRSVHGLVGEAAALSPVNFAVRFIFRFIFREDTAQDVLHYHLID